MNILEDDELVPVNEFADLLCGDSVQVPGIDPRDLRAQSLALHIERHRLPIPDSALASRRLDGHLRSHRPAADYRRPLTQQSIR